ncbi:FtsX-like permease family protein [Kitasatospora sp. NPDC058190]|uniref:FtsX-like permease family protein n=1 Tax=Kitasatospora sp. NPDC058190 TaxID=3346371 RepID=UPI0036D848BE
MLTAALRSLPATLTAALRSLPAGRPRLLSAGLAVAPAVMSASGALILRDILDRSARARFGGGYDDLTPVRGVLELSDHVLLGFTAVAMLAGVLLTVHTCSVAVTRRMRDLALLRAIGAGRAQLLGSVLAESLLAGLAASGVGLAAGTGVGALGARLLTGAGSGMPGVPFAVPASAVAGALALGAPVTAVAALVPALRAAAVPALAVVRPAVVPSGTGRRQTWTGVALLGVGADLLALGLLGSGGLGVVLAGALPALLGLALLTPLISRSAGWALSALFARSLPGLLGRGNPARDTRRTAVTVAALMIGVALVTALGAVAASVRDGAAADLDRDLRAELVATGGGSAAPAAIDPAALAVAARVPGVRGVAAAAVDTATVGGSRVKAVGWQDWATARALLGVRGSAGAVDRLPAGEVLMGAATAEEQGVRVGDRIAVQYRRGAAHSYRVAGIFRDSSLVEGVVVPWADARAGFHTTLASQAFFGLDAGARAEEVRARIAPLLGDGPRVSLLTREQVVDGVHDGFALLFALVRLLLALALLVALLGVVNTLALSTPVRPRELDMLRALGLSRGQTIRMITVESVLNSLLGAVLGIAVGAVLGLAAARALRGDAGGGLSLPWSQPAGCLLAAVVVGVAASIVPARYAARRTGRAALG